MVAPPPGTAEVLEFAGHRLDLRGLELHANDRAYRLTVMEADLLAYLVRHAGAVVSRKAIIETCGGCTRTPTRGQSTTSSCGCGGI